MLHREDLNLRIEEIPVPGRFSGRSIADLDLQSFRHLLLLALKTEGEWLYNPPREHGLREGDVLIFMTSPQEREQLERLFAPSG
jgi:voltage-gated potassium channel